MLHSEEAKKQEVGSDGRAGGCGACAVVDALRYDPVPDEADQLEERAEEEEVGAGLLSTGYVLIRRRRIAAHRACMIAAFVASSLAHLALRPGQWRPGVRPPLPRQSLSPRLCW